MGLFWPLVCSLLIPVCLLKETLATALGVDGDSPGMEGGMKFTIKVSWTSVVQVK